MMFTLKFFHILEDVPSNNPDDKRESRFLVSLCELVLCPSCNKGTLVSNNDCSKVLVNKTFDRLARIDNSEVQMETWDPTSKDHIKISQINEFVVVLD